MAGDGMDRIKHLVVVMMENRSFDNLLGFLYADVNNTPPINIPPPPLGGPTTFDGLVEPNPESPFWNPSNEGYFSKNVPPVKVFAKRGTTGAQPFLVPDHDPHEGFDNITAQIFGPKASTRPDKMRGFLVDYQTTDPGHPENANQLMECYSPERVSVISQLARNYGVCDRWFCSTPNQTLPNRAFVHAGTSMGRVNNKPEPLYEAETIFEVLSKTGHHWRVYNDSFLMSLARLQFPQLWDPLLLPHFRGIGTNTAVATTTSSLQRQFHRMGRAIPEMRRSDSTDSECGSPRCSSPRTLMPARYSAHRRRCLTITHRSWPRCETGYRSRRRKCSPANGSRMLRHLEVS
jgi:phospholipase C